jgi:hypothetical protein
MFPTYFGGSPGDDSHSLIWLSSTKRRPTKGGSSMDFFALDDVPPEVWPHIGTALAAGFAGEARLDVR